VGAGAERRAQVTGEGADVGALRAIDQERRRRRLPGEQFEPVEDDRPRRPLDRLAAAGDLVEALAADLDRGVHRRNLRLWSEEAGQRGLDRGGIERGGVADGGHLALGVLGLRLDPERDPSDVGLGGPGQVLERLPGGADGDREDAGGGGVEGAGVADLALAEQAADAGDDVETGPAGGLSTTR
jgi:hypothetical protein